jgi:hypothetical protein
VIHHVDPFHSQSQRKRSRARSKALLSFFAFTATAAFMLVSVVDPYSGATASPYFQLDDSRFASVGDGTEPVQALDLAGSAPADISRDSFTVSMKPKPKPVPVAASFSAPAAAVPDPGSAQAYAAGAVAARGWGTDQFNCLVSLWQKESGWRVNAMNKSSGAYGIPQSLPGSKMASAGSDWQTSAGTQIEWGLGYISARYGNPCGAWAHSVNVGWY